MSMGILHSHLQFAISINMELCDECAGEINYLSKKIISDIIALLTIRRRQAQWRVSAKAIKNYNR